MREAHHDSVLKENKRYPFFSVYFVSFSLNNKNITQKHNTEEQKRHCISEKKIIHE